MPSSVWMGETVGGAYQAAKSGLIELMRHTATFGGKRVVWVNLLSPA
ncbi:hypothetical protein [Streptomyces sp. NPDC001970]